MIRTKLSFSSNPGFNPGRRMWRREGGREGGRERSTSTLDWIDDGCYGACAGAGINYDKYNKPHRTKVRERAVYYLKIRNTVRIKDACSRQEGMMRGR